MSDKKDKCKTACLECPSYDECDKSSDEATRAAEEDSEDIIRLRNRILNEPLIAIIEGEHALQVAKALLHLGMQFLHIAFQGRRDEAEAFLNTIVPWYWESVEHAQNLKQEFDKAVNGDLTDLKN